MKIPKPAAADAVSEAAHQVTLRNDELAAIRSEIAAAESALPSLALEPDDAKFETASLAIERLRRSELRAQKRLEASHAAYAEAKAGEEQGRRRALYAEGVKAHEEGERLLEQYATKAAEIVEILRGLDKLRAPIDAANKYLPNAEREIDWYEMTRLCESVVLPASTCGGKDFWWRSTEWTAGPLDEPRGRAWQPPRLADLPPPAPRPEQPIGPRTTDNNGRKLMMPPCDFGRAAR